MNKSILILLALALAGVLNSCRDEVPEFELVELDPTIVVEIDLMHQGKRIALNEEFLDNQGNRVRLTSLKYYLSNLQLRSASGEIVKLSEVELFDHKPYDAGISTPQWNKSYKYIVPPDNYTLIEFGLGLPPAINERDPTTYVNEDGLSAYSNMYWSWASMYRFVIFEARVDTTGGTDLSHNLVFHTGTDELYRWPISREIEMNLEAFERDTISLSIDWGYLFQNGPNEIDITTRYNTHTTDSPQEFILAEQFTDNFVSAIYVREGL